MVYSSKHSTDELIGRGLLYATTIAQELRAQIVRRLAREYQGRSVIDLVTMARGILDVYAPQVADTLLDTQIASWVRGLELITSRTPKSVIERIAARLARTSSSIDLPDRPHFIRFPKLMSAVDTLISKGVMTRPMFDRMNSVMRAKTFTVAYQDSQKIISKIKDQVTKSLEGGWGLNTFRAKLAESIGVGKLGDAHLENVFRTNVQRSFNEGQETIMQQPEMHAVFPYARIVPIHDGRVRDSHLALETLGLNGTAVYRSDDPFWRWGTPPISYQCRCSKVLMTIRQASQWGVREAQRWLETGEPPETPEYRYEYVKHLRPTDGFVSPGALFV